MAMTPDEESILKLMINELRTRKKLDAARYLRDAELRDGIDGVQLQVDSTHAPLIASLQADYNASEKAIVEKFA